LVKILIKFLKNRLVIRLILFVFASESVGQVIESISEAQGMYDETSESTGDPQEIAPADFETDGELIEQIPPNADEAYLDEVPLEPPTDHSRSQPPIHSPGLVAAQPFHGEDQEFPNHLNRAFQQTTHTSQTDQSTTSLTYDGRPASFLSPSEIEELSLSEINEIFEQLKVSPLPQVNIRTHVLKSLIPPSDIVLLEFSIVSDHSILLEKEARKRIARVLAAKGYRFQHMSPFETSLRKESLDNYLFRDIFFSNNDFDIRPIVIISTPLKTEKWLPNRYKHNNPNPIDPIIQIFDKFKFIDKIREIVPQKLKNQASILATAFGFMILICALGLTLKYIFFAKKTQDKLQVSHFESEGSLFDPNLNRKIDVLQTCPPDGFLPPIYTPHTQQIAMNKENQNQDQPLSPLPQPTFSPKSSDFFTLPNLHLSALSNGISLSNEKMLTLKADKSHLQLKFRDHPVSVLLANHQKNPSQPVK
jgi:hypothetical protein